MWVFCAHLPWFKNCKFTGFGYHRGAENSLIIKVTVALEKCRKRPVYLAA